MFSLCAWSQARKKVLTVPLHQFVTRHGVQGTLCMINFEVASETSSAY